MILNNFVIDRIVRAVGKSSDGDVKFIINQVTNASLNVTSETAEAVDAMGAPIAIFNRAKTAEFSAENALFDLDLMALQAGEDKEGNGSKFSTSTGAVISVPAFEEVKEGKLRNTPAGEVKFYEINENGSLGDALPVSANGGTDGGIVVGEDNSLTGLPEGTNVMAIYEYNAANAVSVVNSANKFPKACELVLEVLGCDVCKQDELIYAYLIFPNFKISPDFDWSIATDGTHPFSGTAMQDYCDAEKVLYKLVVVDDEE